MASSAYWDGCRRRGSGSLKEKSTQIIYLGILQKNSKDPAANMSTVLVLTSASSQFIPEHLSRQRSVSNALPHNELGLGKGDKSLNPIRCQKHNRICCHAKWSASTITPQLFFQLFESTRCLMFLNSSARFFSLNDGWYEQNDFGCLMVSFK